MRTSMTIGCVLMGLMAACPRPPESLEAPTAPVREPPQPSAVPSAAQTEFDALVDQARVQIRRGDIDAAMQMLARARADTDDALAIARLDVVGVRGLLAQGEVERAMALAERTAKEMEELHADDGYLAEAYNSLAYAYFVHLEPSRALEIWRRAERHCTGDDPSIRLMRGRIRFNRAMLLDLMGRTEQALPIARSGLVDETAGGASPCPELALTRGSLARLLAHVGRVDEADAMLREGLEACEHAADAEVVRAELQLTLGELQAQQGRTDEALATLGAARALLESKPETVVKAIRGLIFESSILRKAGRAAQAHALLSEVAPRLEQKLESVITPRFSLCFERLLVLAEIGGGPEQSTLVDDCRHVAEQLGHHPGSPARGELERHIERLDRVAPQMP